MATTTPPKSGAVRATALPVPALFLRYSRSLSIEWSLHQNIYPVADLGLGVTHSSDRQLQHGGGVHTNSRYPPRFQPLLKMDDDPLLVKIDGVDREPHRKGVNSVAGDNP